MTPTHRPAAAWELASVITEANRRGTPLEVAGSGSKQSVGRPMQTALTVSTAGLRGVTLYEPSELVMAAQSGTHLSEIEQILHDNNQMLPFEPLDLGPMLGKAPQLGTIGAVFATNLSGARRIAAGAARDQLLGVQAVNGRGESFKSGGRVMKNVTGYDVARGLTGSWGTLAVLTEVTFKLLPKPEENQTLVIFGLPDDIAVDAMSAALGTPYEVSGTVHIQATLAGRLRNAHLASLGKSVTAIRLENFSRFLPARIAKLKSVLAPFGDIHVLPDETSTALWSELRELSVLQGSDAPLWRISVPPDAGPRMVSDITRQMPAEAFYDWSGGLVWLQVPGAADAGATDIRRVIARSGGHATLIRAAPSVRAAVDVFQPLDEGIDRLTRQIKASFDPAGVLNPGRMYNAI